jgi:hypothetical protein
LSLGFGSVTARHKRKLRKLLFTSISKFGR